MKRTIRLNKLVTKNPHLYELVQLITVYKDLFIECAVHGSYATDEEIKYSDFDGLYILRDSVFENEKYLKDLKSFLYRSAKIIYRIDPLQHHGWFSIRESELLDYPQTYFPHELFEYSKSLMSSSREFDIYLKREYDYSSPFNRLRTDIAGHLKNRPKNLYQLKCFLSELMLLPCFYLQAKYKSGFYKRDSFDLARAEFTDKDWSPIITASLIRNEWDFKLGTIQNLIMQQPGKIFRKITKTFIAPRIPDSCKKYLTEVFYSGCGQLTDLMNKNLMM